MTLRNSKGAPMTTNWLLPLESRAKPGPGRLSIRADRKHDDEAKAGQERMTEWRGGFYAGCRRGKFEGVTMKCCLLRFLSVAIEAESTRRLQRHVRHRSRLVCSYRKRKRRFPVGMGMVNEMCVALVW